METVLVTGGTGFLGKYVIKELVDNGYSIITIGRNEEKGKLLNSPDVKFVKCDFTNLKDLESVFKKYKFDYVVHAGAMSTVWGRWKEFYRANVLGTENVATLSLNYKAKRLIYISSPSIYTEKFDRFNILETDYRKDNKINYYIRTKTLSEEIIGHFAKIGLYNVIIRPRGLFGIGDTSVIPRLLKANYERGIPLVDGGKNYIDITCVENVAYAIRLCIEKDDINNEVFNITNGEPDSFKNIIDSFFEKMGQTPNYINLSFRKLYFIASTLELFYKLFRIYKEPFVTKYSTCILGKTQTMNIEKASTKLGYKPIMSMEEGIIEYVKDRQKSRDV